MLTYPELDGGSRVQYPLRKVRKTKARRWEPLGSDAQVLYEANAEELRWELEYAGLNAAEAARLRDFFEAARGGLKEFVFCDPSVNLLSHSADLTNEAWTRGGFLVLTTGLPDPFGGSDGWRVTNQGQAEQRLSQTLPVETGTFCLSCWMRSSVVQRVSLRVGDTVKEASAGPQWRREWVSGHVASAHLGIEVGLDLAAGAQVGVYGLQADAQPAPEEYRESKGTGGVYERTRIAQDALVFVEDAPGVFRTRIALVSKAGGR
jgi:hypothetical protein